MAEETPAQERIADFIDTDTYGSLLPQWQRRMLNQIRRNAPPPISEENTEILRWGSPEAVPGETIGTLYQSGRRNEENNTNEEEKANPTVIYREVSRSTATVRVENPTDPEQYVDVVRINEITFQGSDNKNHRFILNWS